MGWRFQASGESVVNAYTDRVKVVCTRACLHLHRSEHRAPSFRRQLKSPKVRQINTVLRTSGVSYSLTSPGIFNGKAFL